MGLRVDIVRSAYRSQLNVFDGVDKLTLVNVSGADEPSAEAPAARLVPGHIEGDLIDYIVSIVHATRNHPALLLGASPRGSLALVRTSQASALLDGRDYVIPDDIKEMARWVLPHRFVTRERSRSYFRESAEIVSEILEQVPVPVEAGGRRGEGS